MKDCNKEYIHVVDMITDMLSRSFLGIDLIDGCFDWGMLKKKDDHDRKVVAHLMSSIPCDDEGKAEFRKGMMGTITTMYYLLKKTPFLVECVESNFGGELAAEFVNRLGVPKESKESDEKK